jgi:uncharacterized protein
MELWGTQMTKNDETKIARRHVLGALAASSVAVATTVAASAQERAVLKLADIKKETDQACAYHCDFGDANRFDQMLRNINNHLSVYDFDPLTMKIVIVAHGPGVKFFMKSLEGTPWAKDQIDPEIIKRMEALAKYGVEAMVCRITFERLKLDVANVKQDAYIKIVPSGVATVAALQGKGFAYLKVG